MIGKIDHIGIAVRSIEEARGFYELLGLAIREIEEVPQEGVRVAMIPCGESLIELLEPTTPESPIAKFLEKRGPGIHHLCLAADDVRAADATLREGGVQMLRPAPTRGAGGCWVQFVHPKSTGGVLLELSEAPVPLVSLAPGAVILAHLVQPTEKLWGELLELAPAGVTLRALNLDSLEEWIGELAKGETPGSGPVVTFVPMHRVERLFLDEPAGSVESHCQRLERRVGRPALELLRGA